VFVVIVTVVNQIWVVAVFLTMEIRVLIGIFMQIRVVVINVVGWIRIVVVVLLVEVRV